MLSRDLKKGEASKCLGSPEPRSDPGDWDWTRSLAGAADALLVFSPALTLARELSLSQIARSHEFVSATARAGFEPLTNYVQFALCAIVVWGAFFLGYRRGNAVLAWIPVLAARASRMSRTARAILWTLAVAALVVYFVNVTAFTPGGPIKDGLHEGEYLGFVPVLAAGKAVLTSTFSTHGPGVDFIPGWVASRFGSPEHGIIATRLAYAMLRTGTVLASLFIVLTFTRLLSPASSRVTWFAQSALAFMFLVVALQIAGWRDVPVFHKSPNARDFGYLLQVLAVLLFARVQNRARSPALALAIAAVSGASLPWAIIYSYDRGLYGAAFLFLASIAFGMCDGNWARRWFAGLSSGAAIGSAALYAAFGPEGVGAVLEQLSYWLRYGRDLFAYAGVAALPDTFAGGLLVGSLIALALGMARVVRAIAVTGVFREAVRGEIGVIVLIAASIPGLRTAIERGDVGHVAWGVTVSWIMLSVLAAKFATDTLRAMLPADRHPRPTDNASLAAHVVMVGVSALVGYNLAYLDPFTGYARLHNDYYGALQISDRKILSPEQAGALDAIRGELQSSSCFYTLTNEGAWYYLVQKPSCSRFYEVTNARPISAQHEVVAALQATSPAVILFSGGWSDNIDGISPFNANPEVMRYVLQHYVPHALVAENWFWKRSSDPLQFSDRKVGTTMDTPADATTAWDLRIAGTYGTDSLTAPPKAIFLTDGDENTPIWAGRPAPDEYLQERWSAVVPTAVLAPGGHRLRVWAFRGQGVPLLQLGSQIEVRIR